MTFKKTSFLFITLLMVSTYMPFKKYDLKFTSAGKVAKSEVPVPQKISQHDDVCFEAKMEAWFLAFDQYQSMGFDMQQADNIATSDANIAYKNCNNNDNVQIASNE